MADQPNSTDSNGFDPFSQQVALTTEYGETVLVRISDIDDIMQYAIRICINYASQLGASLILLLILLILAKHDKRRSPIFIFNALALLLNFIRSLMQCLYYTSQWYHPYAIIANDYSRIKSRDYANSVAAAIVQLLLGICIEASLVMQVHVICITMERTRHAAIMILSSVIALAAIAVRFTLTVVNVQYVLFAKGMVYQQKISIATNLIMAISICFFSMIFCTKLGFAIRNRRRLGLKQFGPMQIIFIMGCQTMIVPAIFSLLQFGTQTPYLGSQVLNLVAIFLPLSAIWASASTNDRDQAFREHNAHHKMLGQYSYDSDPGEKRNDSSSSSQPLTIP